jgi:Na+-transporting NADH:ubiquinone oxidoreductase subunit NqrB
MSQPATWTRPPGVSSSSCWLGWRERGSGVVIVTHDNRIMNVAGRVLHLSDGTLVGRMN